MTDGGLPDLAALAHVPDRTWRAIGDRWREVGFDAALCASMWHGPPDAYPGLHGPVHRWRAATRDDAAAVVYRLFASGDDVPATTVAAALTSTLSTSLTAAGVLRATRTGGLVATLDLRVHDGLLLLCDRVGRGGDAVFGTGPGSPAFRGAVSSRWPAGTVLDVGCGAGAALLAAARHARTATGTDVNPRAATLLRVNAAVNGLAGVELLVGDLLAPVRGRRFDLVLAQLPFVPRPPGAAPESSRLAGPAGTEVVARLLDGLAPHLTGTGRAVVVHEVAVRRDGSEVTPVPTRAPEGLHVLSVRGDVTDADVYAVRYALPGLRTSVRDHDAALVAMREHLDRLDVAGVRPAVTVVERAAGSPGWTHVRDVAGTLWGAVGEASLWRLLAGARALQGETDVHLALPAGAFTAAPVGGTSCRLLLPPDHLVPREEWSTAQVDALARGAPVDATTRDRALRWGLVAEPQVLA